jgi:hypothetical protein
MDNILEAAKFIDYNAETGEVKHLLRKNSNGSFDKDGYLIIKIKGKQYKAHRLAYAKYHNCIPNGVIDHINRIPSDNRIINLRDTTQHQNCLNVIRKPNHKTGIIGVYLDNTNGLKKKYATKILNKTYRFYTLQEAIDFRKNINYAI